MIRLKRHRVLNQEGIHLGDLQLKKLEGCSEPYFVRYAPAQDPAERAFVETFSDLRQASDRYMHLVESWREVARCEFVPVR